MARKVMKTLNGYEIYDDQARQTLKTQSNKIATQANQIDQLIAGTGTPANGSWEKELQDIRNGVDGVKYASAGAAIRATIEAIPRMSVSATEPTASNVNLWINPIQTDEHVIPEIKDEEISQNDTWSSQKINNTFNDYLLKAAYEQTIKTLQDKISELEEKLNGLLNTV